jgi:hypothetical protein
MVCDATEGCRISQSRAIMETTESKSDAKRPEWFNENGVVRRANNGIG